MRPVFCGNLDYDARQSEIERLFSKYGRVERVDMKSGISWSICALPGWTGLYLSCLRPASSFAHLQELRVHLGICSLGDDHLVNDALLLLSALHPSPRCTLLPRPITISHANPTMPTTWLAGEEWKLPPPPL